MRNLHFENVSPFFARLFKKLDSTLKQIMISKLTKKIGSFLLEEDGPTAVEYAVMLGLIIITCIAAVLALGGATNGLLSDSLAKMQAVFSN